MLVGVGMSPELLERVQAAFEWADSGNTHRFGGRGQGATLIVALPLSLPQSNDTVTLAASSPATGLVEVKLAITPVIAVTASTDGVIGQPVMAATLQAEIAWVLQGQQA